MVNCDMGLGGGNKKTDMVKVDAIVPVNNEQC